MPKPDSRPRQPLPPADERTRYGVRGGEPIFITGLGPVSAIGVGTDDFARALAEGRCGLGEITSFEIPPDGPQLAAEALGFNVEPLLRSAKNYLDRNSQLAFGAIELALRHARLELREENLERLALCAGSACGNMETLETFNRHLVEKGPRLVPPFLFQHTYPNTSISLLTIEYGITGWNAQFCSGLAAGLEAVAYAAQIIRRGRADAALAGGMDALSKPIYLLWRGLGRLSRPPEEGCRPFSPSHNGTVLGEGAAFLVLESGLHMRKREAYPLAELAGVGVAATPAEAMRLALQDAGCEQAQIGALFGSANGEPELDDAEKEAIGSIFKLGTPEAPPVICLKPLIGETQGAGGPLALCAAALSLSDGPIRLEKLCDPSSRGSSPWERRGEAALVNSFDPSGTAVSIVLKRPAESGA